MWHVAIFKCYPECELGVTLWVWVSIAQTLCDCICLNSDGCSCQRLGRGHPCSNGPKNCAVDISFGRDPWWWAFGAESACRSPLWVQQDLSMQIELTTQMRVAPFRVAPGSSLMIAVLLPSCDIILGLKNWFLWPPLFLVLLVILLPCWFT